MADLESIIGISVEFHKFHNVDLFQRGFYQVRCSLRVSPRATIQIESNGLSSSNETKAPQTVVRGSGTSKIFQILYRNEEVILRDVVVYHIHLPVESKNIAKSIERAEFSMIVELWCGEKATSGALSLISTRTLQLNFHPVHGLHYHLPVLFDYFHMSSVVLGIHASLIAIYNNSQKSLKTWNGRFSCRTGKASNHTEKPSKHLTSHRLSFTQQVHSEICALLIDVLKSLSKCLTDFNSISSKQWTFVDAKTENNDLFKRLTQIIALSNNTRDTGSIEDLKIEIAWLNKECTIFWKHVLEAAKQPAVHNFLSKRHHMLRVKRFAEGFFVQNNAREIHTQYNESNYQNFDAIYEAARRSHYINSLPLLPVHCVLIDGDSSSLPFIFEDKYDNAIMGNGGIGEQHNGYSPATRGTNFCWDDPNLALQWPDYENGSERDFVGVLTPRLALGGDVLQASLTITPSAHNNSIQGSSARRSVSNYMSSKYTNSSDSSVKFPARHSKSFDQLRLSASNGNGHHQVIDESEINSSLACAANENRTNGLKLINFQKSNSIHHKLNNGNETITTNTNGCNSSKMVPVNTQYSFDKRKRSDPSHLRATRSEYVIISPNPSIQNSPKLCTISDYRIMRPMKTNRNQANSNEMRLVRSEVDIKTSVNNLKLQSSASMPTQLKEIDETIRIGSESMPNLIQNKVAMTSNYSFDSYSSSVSVWDTSRKSSLTSINGADKQPILYQSNEDVQHNKSGRNMNKITLHSLNNINCETEDDCFEEKPLIDLQVLSPLRSKIDTATLANMLSNTLRNGTNIINGIGSNGTSIGILSNKNMDSNLLILTPPDQFRDPPLYEPTAFLGNRENSETNKIKNSYSHMDSNGIKHSHAEYSSENSINDLIEPKSDNENDYDDEDDVHSEEENNSDVKDNCSLDLIKCRNEFRKQINYTGHMYCDLKQFASEIPYFHINDQYRVFSPNGLHLIVCVHGLDGSSADLRLVKTYLELGLPGANVEFLMSECNQGDAYSNLDTMADRLVAELMNYFTTSGSNPSRISFVGHSLGTIVVRTALSKPQMRYIIPRLHTYLSLSGPHLGILFNNNGLVNMGIWFMQKWKRSGCLAQLCLRDSTDLRQSFLYRLSQTNTLHHFKNVLLCGSNQDRYVPPHSARMELCKAAVRDTSVIGTVYREMVHNLLTPIMVRTDLTFIRYDVHHALPNTANALIGRAAHIAVLDSELFIEKFLLVSGLKYFR